MTEQSNWQSTQPDLAQANFALQHLGRGRVQGRSPHTKLRHQIGWYVRSTAPNLRKPLLPKLKLDRVSLADKLHNARSLWMDWQRLGPDLWNQFGCDRHQTVWFYQSLVEIYQERTTGSLVDELSWMVKTLREQTQPMDEFSSEAPRQDRVLLL